MNNLNITSSWPTDYPEKIKKYSWSLETICGPFSCYRDGMQNVQKDSPIFWKNFIITELEREKWDEEKLSLNSLSKFVNYLINSFTICFTDEKRFFINYKKDKKIGKVKFKKEEFFEICKELGLNEKKGASLLRKLLKKSLEFYEKFQ